MNGLNHTHGKKPKLALPIFKLQDNFSDALNPFSDTQTPSINNTNSITSPPTFYTKRPNKFYLTRLKLFPKRSTLSQPTVNYRTSTLSPSQEQNPPVPNCSTCTAFQHDNYPNQHENLTTKHDNQLITPLSKMVRILPSKFTLQQIIIFFRHLFKSDII